MKNNFAGIRATLLSLLVMALWGSLFPFIKIGYKAFCIDATDIPSILMFAGTRFTICGVVISMIAFRYLPVYLVRFYLTKISFNGNI